MTKQAEAMFTALEGPVEAAPAELQTTGSLVEVLRERQLNKTASIFANIAAGAAQHAGTALRTFGTNPMTAGAVGGAALGGIGGAITAEEGQGMSGFLRGAAAGGALGAGAGYAAPAAFKNIGQLGTNLQRAGAQARGLSVDKAGKITGEVTDVAKGGLKGVGNVLKGNSRTAENIRAAGAVRKAQRGVAKANEGVAQQASAASTGTATQPSLFSSPATGVSQTVQQSADDAAKALEKARKNLAYGGSISGQKALGIGAAGTAGAGMVGGMTTGGGNQGQVT